MKNMISASEAAAKWNISTRSVTGMCAKGRIKGAVKVGHSWFISELAEKPEDLRFKHADTTQIADNEVLLPLPVGLSFYKKASTEHYYIDKTMLIKDIIDEGTQVTLFTRPRRFGKTLNMDMLRTFFEKTDENTSVYFKDKKIWSCGQKYRDYQGKNPVIYLTFKDTKYRKWDQALEEIRMVISDEYRRHRELTESTVLDSCDKAYIESIISEQCSEVSLGNSLAALSKFLTRIHGKETVIIIDEYDTPVQSGYTNGYYDDVIAFMRNFISKGFKDNPNLAFGFLTGILRVAKESIFSGMNNLAVNSVLDDKYSEYFGFTAEDVRNIAIYYKRAPKYTEICEWYDGYRFGNTDIFNPWSVINYFRNGCKPGAFWISTSSNDIIGEILKTADTETTDKLTALLKGEAVSTHIDTSVIYPQLTDNPSSIFSFLLVTGYLKSIKSTLSQNGDYMYEVTIPNKEVSTVYRKEIMNRLVRIVPYSTSIALEEALFTGDAIRLKEMIGKFLLCSASSFDTAGESFYHGFMLGIVALFGCFYVTSNREAGEGRYDICMTPKRKDLPGVIIELKAGKNCTSSDLKGLSETALKQINDKKYETELVEKGVQTVYKYGVAFSGKNVEITM